MEYEVRKREISYSCDYVDCKERSWLGKGLDWKMCEIVFGVHPTIVYKAFGRPLCTIQKKFHFCRRHHWIKENLFHIIAEEFPEDIERICTKASLVDGLGCWITVHDCLSPGERIRNFQLPYDIFERIYRRFCFFKSNELSLRKKKLLNLFCEVAL